MSIDLKSNIINQDEFDEYVQATLKHITTALTKSLGPYGSTTIMEDQFMKDNITKDGFTILSNLKFDNPIAITVLGMIKDISGDLVRTVGDGSTSSVLAASKLYEMLSTKMNEEPLKSLPKKTIMDKMEELRLLINKTLDNYVTPITEDNMDVLKNIASVSNNNDSQSGSIIYDIYKEIGLNGMLFLDESTSPVDTYEVHNGLTTNYGYADPVFVNKSNQVDCVLESPIVLLFRNKLTRDDATTWMTDFIGKFVSSLNQAIVFVAPSYDMEVINIMKNNIQNNLRHQINLPVALTTYNVEREDYNDLALYLGTDILDSTDDSFNDFLQDFKVQPQTIITNWVGKCDEVVMNESTTTFLNGRHDSAKMDAYIANLETKKEIYTDQNPTKHTTMEIFKIDKRIANLRGQIATLFVGGSTERERKTRKYLLDDAVHATESAIKNGYIAGGNLAVCKAIYDIQNDEKVYGTLDDADKMLLSAVSDSMIYVYIKALENASITFERHASETPYDSAYRVVSTYIADKKTFDVKEEVLEDDKDTHIINSVETDKMILKSALSIIGLLATSNQYLSKTMM